MILMVLMTLSKYYQHIMAEKMEMWRGKEIWWSLHNKLQIKEQNPGFWTVSPELFVLWENHNLLLIRKADENQK